jgi:mono/diheme cytochrome c family protein
LNTRWEDPYWCVPDPDPNFSPCEAVLRVVPGGSLIVEPEIAATPTAESTTPEAAPPAGPTSTPRPVAGEDAASIILNAGCGVCHRLNSIGLEGEIGPELSNAAEWAGERVAGLNAAEYIRQSILEPGAFIAPDCPEEPCHDGIMPANYADRLTDEQIEAIVEFLLNQETDSASGSGFSLPPRIGQNDLPLGTSSGSAGTQSEPTSQSTLLVIGLITLIIILGLGTVIVRRRNGREET